METKGFIKSLCCSELWLQHQVCSDPESNWSWLVLGWKPITWIAWYLGWQSIIQATWYTAQQKISYHSSLKEDRGKKLKHLKKPPKPQSPIESIEVTSGSPQPKSRFINTSPHPESCLCNPFFYIIKTALARMSSQDTVTFVTKEVI